ncbi:hypothetical protein H632_c467p1 [Helicosporidium sp. ATCC 50920]|nr:hypothetical protein H632_c467p1 [Helicosporidium sp. ATCC 50920]|eukprot:KDD75858.1 hypothetical protein H632_c467p1 [Helicosporidium sp. ATCC 50920]
MSTDAPAPAGQPEEDPLVQYVVLREDLHTTGGWQLGSLVAQGCHASLAAVWDSREAADTQAYLSSQNRAHMRKVVLAVRDEEALRALAAKLHDKGLGHCLWIEQPENEATCLATVPALKSRAFPLVRRVKLCKGVVQ